jgi:hypothetical protein
MSGMLNKKFIIFVPLINLKPYFMFDKSFSPNTEKLKWTDTQANFISFIEILHATGLPNASIDQIGEHLLSHMEVDLSPFPDFRSMRIALEKEVDTDKFLQEMNDALIEQYQLDHTLKGTGVISLLEEEIRQNTNSFFVQKLDKYFSSSN